MSLHVLSGVFRFIQGRMFCHIYQDVGLGLGFSCLDQLLCSETVTYLLCAVLLRTRSPPDFAYSSSFLL